MTFHDANRLDAHLGEYLQQRGLFLELQTWTIGQVLALKINDQTGYYSISADTLAHLNKSNPHDQRGTKKTWLKHLSILEQYGIFKPTRHRQRQARFWELALPCPPSCVGKDFENHNSPQRRKQLEQQARVVDNYDQKSNLGDQKSKAYSTNREYIDIDDIEIQFSKLGLGEFITWTISQLPELNQQHNSLLEYLETNKAEVESKALAILNERKPTKRGRYLTSIVANTPKVLFEKLVNKPKEKTKASSKSVATIHTTATTARVTFPRLKGYASKQLGFEITEATKLYLLDKLKLKLPIGHRDLIICMEVERHNKQLRDEQLNTNSELELSCRNGLPNLSWTGENHNWNFYTDEFLEANGRPHYKEGYKLAQAHIEELNNQLVRLYELLPLNSNLEAYNLEFYLLSNYGIDEDYQEFLEVYPAKQEGISWNAEKGKASLLSAQQRGYSFDEIIAEASALPRNSANWANHKQHPHTWLDSLPTKEQARADKEQIDSVTASSLADLVNNLSNP
jgi:hypothetical protein